MALKWYLGAWRKLISKKPEAGNLSLTLRKSFKMTMKLSHQWPNNSIFPTSSTIGSLKYIGKNAWKKYHVEKRTRIVNYSFWCKKKLRTIFYTKLHQALSLLSQQFFSNFNIFLVLYVACNFHPYNNNNLSISEV